MKKQIVDASRQYFISHIEKHKLNVEVMLANPLAIHDHTDLMSAIEKEIEQIAEYEDKLAVLTKYFVE
jgi:hypothetical protein